MGKSIFSLLNSAFEGGLAKTVANVPNEQVNEVVNVNVPNEQVNEVVNVDPLKTLEIKLEKYNAQPNEQVNEVKIEGLMLQTTKKPSNKKPSDVDVTNTVFPVDLKVSEKIKGNKKASLEVVKSLSFVLRSFAHVLADDHVTAQPLQNLLYQLFGSELKKQTSRDKRTAFMLTFMKENICKTYRHEVNNEVVFGTPVWKVAVDDEGNTIRKFNEVTKKYETVYLVDEQGNGLPDWKRIESWSQSKVINLLSSDFSAKEVEQGKAK